MKKTLVKLSIMLLFSSLLMLLISCNNTKKDWEKAQHQSTVESYNSFIEKHPGSEFVQSAKMKIIDLDWEYAINADSIAVYKDFLTKHPESEQIKEAKERLIILEWEQAKKINTIDYYKKFLNDYPKSIFTDSTNQRISDLEGTWENGFFNKEYMVDEEKIDDAIHQIFKNCIAFSYGSVPNGYTKTYGVGDDKGNWSLNGEGGLVTVKIENDKHVLSVGFKINKGDRKASQYFHKLLEEKLSGCN